MTADGRSREEKVIIAAQLQSALQCFASCVDEDFEVVEILASEASLMSASLSTALCACEDEETRQDPVAMGFQTARASNDTVSTQLSNSVIRFRFRRLFTRC